jgi:monoamine oxidase
MGRTKLFRNITRAFRIADTANRHHLRTDDLLEKIEEAQYQYQQQQFSRRQFLALTGSAAGAALIAQPAYAISKLTSGVRIAIIGGGTAGIVCASELAKHGHSATIYEANSKRLGGRMWSSHRIPGKVIERGGEFIDSDNPLLLSYVKSLGLHLEDVNDIPGAGFYFINGKQYSEAEIVNEIRVFAKRIHPDQTKIKEPTFFKHNAHEAKLDFTDLATYLDRHARDLPLARTILDLACNIEYGLETSEQSALNLLLSLEVAKDFSPFEIYSDERYHIVEGNSQIPQRLAEQLPGQIHTAMQLTRLRRNSFNQFELYFNNSPTPEIADAVVLAIPFSVLRTVELDPSLKLSADKMRAINELKYGDNVKTMYGFNGRPWVTAGCNGDVLTDLGNIQNTWETNWFTAKETSVITNYSGGDLARRLQLMGHGTRVIAPVAMVKPPTS